MIRWRRAGVDIFVVGAGRLAERGWGSSDHVTKIPSAAKAVSSCLALRRG